MIPDHLIDKAAAGIDKFLAEIQRGDWGNYPDLLARAALEAVAADIWREGFERAHVQHAAFDIRMGRRTQAIVEDNPYRASETA